MPSLTAGGLPYPLGTEPVRDGDNAIKALADALQVRTLGYQFVASQVIVTTNAAGGFGITFTRPFKTGNNPFVLCQHADGSGTSLVVLASMNPPTVTGFSGVARNTDGNYAVGNIRITYLAIGVAP
jgi:phosphoribosylaminoimidazole (AIR) synthetase